MIPTNCTYGYLHASLHQLCKPKQVGKDVWQALPLLQLQQLTCKVFMTELEDWRNAIKLEPTLHPVS